MFTTNVELNAAFFCDLQKRDTTITTKDISKNIINLV